MNIKILELEKNKIRMVLVGEKHTFMNLLEDEIIKDPSVNVGKYVVEYQFSDPELLVTTDGTKDPLTVIREACERINRSCDEVLTQVGSVVK
ncbi:MAG: DNA-directed RNA polymerase subunit L [Methanocalculus sp. MSAO_Arc1]|uniref:DNA-directed RNA polymerase subunit L n=1 Tax=Methanocalculus TaxID=71151 RepID=UPI000FF0D3CF|nr:MULTISPECIES: DNA-directed RNA polymerase subunit L [unclassified Methanocalculus]MCP1662697.1 DNA-directed RNA polymerase subunit L [Methanocalculus sp. AMF5]RQD80276.1 MAG: DNA-directed RNA polymerase subunit L [Methanocalculus sp. MSAO_Arc1]